MASGWNVWVWLECIGVVSGCCCKEVYRYPHNNYINFPYYTCIYHRLGNFRRVLIFLGTPQRRNLKTRNFFNVA